MIGLLGLLRLHADAVEADLSRYHGLDYRDRWRRGPDGRRLLTLRQIAVRVRHLPPDSATAVAVGGSGWVTGDYLTADVFHALAGKEHPSRPSSSAAVGSSARTKAMRRARARAAQRRRQIAAGEIT